MDFYIVLQGILYVENFPLRRVGVSRNIKPSIVGVSFFNVFIFIYLFIFPHDIIKYPLGI